MKGDEQTTADGVFDVPQGGHHVGRARGKEGAPKGQGALDTRDGSDGRAARGEDDDARRGEPLMVELSEVERSRIARGRIGCEEKTARRGDTPARRGVSGEVNHFAPDEIIEEGRLG